MAWIELHQTLPRHPKLARLANRLRITRAQAAGHLTFLWLWSLDYCPTGNLSALEPAEISAAADFGGDPELFCQALRQSGWVDESGLIHDWMEYAGKLITERERDKKRKREARLAEVEKLSGGHPADGGRTATVPNPTQPNSIQPNPNTEGADAPKRARMEKPSLEEVKLQAAKVALPESEAVKFHSYYESNGWRVGKNPMRSWVGAMTNWKANYDERNRGTGSTGGRHQGGDGRANRNADIADLERWRADYHKTAAEAARAGDCGPDFGA